MATDYERLKKRLEANPAYAAVYKEKRRRDQRLSYQRKRSAAPSTLIIDETKPYHEWNRPSQVAKPAAPARMAEPILPPPPMVIIKTTWSGKSLDQLIAEGLVKRDGELPDPPVETTDQVVYIKQFG